MTIKKDYMDILLTRVEEKFTEYVLALEEMVEAKNNGEFTYIETYIKQIAPAVHHYYVLMDDVWREAVINVGVKKRHRIQYGNICELDKRLDQLAEENGFRMGMLGAH